LPNGLLNGAKLVLLNSEMLLEVKGAFRCIMKRFWGIYSGQSMPIPSKANSKHYEIPYVFQYTITGYGHDLEPHIPRLENVIDDFIAISKTLPSPECIQWRYDPIVISKDCPVKFHLAHFRAIASALQDYTRIVNVSFPEPYAKTVRRMNELVEVQYRQLNPRHKLVSTRYPNLLQVGQQAHILLDSLVSIAAEYLIELRICSNPEWSSLPNSQCCSLALFAPYGTELVNQINQLEQSPSRQGCHCLKTIDIGMDNTSVSGCRYCYAVQSQETAVRNFKQHDPQKTMLR